MKEIDEIVRLAKAKGIVRKESNAKSVWSEPGVMHILQCESCLIKAVFTSDKTWSIITQ